MNYMVQLIGLMGNKKLAKIIDFSLRNQSKEFSQTELIKNIKLAKATMIKWLRFLVKEDILLLRQVGLTNLYSLNNNNLAVKELKRLNHLLRLQELRQLGEGLEIYLYGSCARGEDVEDSDCDILVIGNINKEKATEFTRRIEKKLGKSINLQIFSHYKWSEMAKKDKAFYERVEKDKVRLN